MRLYLLYVLAALFNFYLLMLYYGISAGFANYAPILAIWGSVLMLGVAAPVLMINRRIGLIIGLISCLLLLIYDIPYLLMNLRKVFLENKFQWEALLFSTPPILTIVSAVLTIKYIFFTKGIGEVYIKSKLMRGIIAATPIIIVLLYLIFYGKYWSWQMFKI